jgi:hypothetical protein
MSCVSYIFIPSVFKAATSFRCGDRANARIVSSCIAYCALHLPAFVIRLQKNVIIS